MRSNILQGGLAVAASAVLLTACQAPLGGEEGREAFQRYVEAAIDRELTTLPEDAEPLQLTQPPGEVERALSERREELDQIGPAMDIDTSELEMGEDLTGADQKRVVLSLEDAVLTAVANNLRVEGSRLQPAISAEDVIAAEAVFDWLLFANYDFQKIDEPQTVPVIMGIPLGSSVSGSEIHRFDTGVRKRFTAGGSAFASTDVMRYRNRSEGIGFAPDPAYTAALRLGVTQPLLRGFGTEVNTASIRLAENAQQRTVEQLRLELLGTVDQTEAAYWDLVFAWRILVIRQWLVDVGVEVRDVLERRMDFDTKLAQYSDAVATVERRKADVIRARREVRRASDALKGLIDDPTLTVGSESVLVPVGELPESPISYSLRDAIVTAVSNRPEVRQAALAIGDARIRQLLADNARLPLLNLSAEMAYFGLDDGVGDAYDPIGEGSFIDYLLGLALEYPIGNRAAEAGYRQARLQRSAAVIAYRQAVQNVVLDVKSALRDVVTDYRLIQATRSFRVAQAENLRALRVEEETLAGLTPEFLNLKFQRQEVLGLARAEEIQAMVSFQQSVANLYRAMGTALEMKGIGVEVIDDPEAPLMDDASGS